MILIQEEHIDRIDEGIYKSDQQVKLSHDEGEDRQFFKSMEMSDCHLQTVEAVHH